MREVTGDDIKPEIYERAHVEVCLYIFYAFALGNALLLPAGDTSPMCAQQVKSGAIDHEFETMYAKLRAWRDAYGTTMVPKQVRRLVLSR